MNRRFERKVAIVTGAGSGYGFGIATKLKSEGADIVIADISEINGSQAAKELNAIFVQTDVAKRDHWQTLLETTIKQYGRLDIVVNNAGVCYDKKPTHTVTEQEFDLAIAVNVKSIFHSAAVIIPHFLEQGHDAVFINIASTSAIRPRPELAWYAASKAAVNVASNAMAVEYASKKIRFNTVCPVVGLTAMTSDMNPADRAAFASVIPVGRMCTPEDVASAVCYLASPEAIFITGVNLQVDGGRCV